MQPVTKKSVKNGLIGLAVIGTFSFMYGGIYTEMIKEGLEISFGNIIYAFIGSFIISGTLLGFIPVFLISYIGYQLKK